MKRVNTPDYPSLVYQPHVLPGPEERAEEILKSLIVQTAQAEYDNVTVEKLINEYERLMC